MQHDDRRTVAGDGDVDLGAVVGEKVGHDLDSSSDPESIIRPVNTVEYGNG
jgi:hypothetical protein